MKTISIFGASGQSGIEIIKLALEKEFRINAFCRNKNSFTFNHSNLNIIEGDLLLENNLNIAVRDADYVISALGTKPPYRDIFCYEALRKIILAMYDFKIMRLVCITGAMIGDMTPNHSKFVKFMASRFNKSKPLAALDRLKQETVVKASKLNWTLIKPPRLTNGPLSDHKLGEYLKVTAFSSISRKTVASLIINILDDKSTYQKSLFAVH